MSSILVGNDVRPLDDRERNPHTLDESLRAGDCPEEQSCRDHASWCGAGAFGYRVPDVQVRRGFDVLHAPDLLSARNPALGRILSRWRKLLVVVDSEVYRLYGDQITRYFEFRCPDYRLVALPRTVNNESNKSVERWLELLQESLDFELTKGDAFVAIGGGVTCDLVGFLASTMRRGVAYVAIPTTLGSMVDASISPKTAVNIPGDKNGAGTVHAPTAVVWDPQFLKTDPSRRTGIAELIKIAVMCSSSLFDTLEANLSQLNDSAFSGEIGTSVLDSGIRVFLESKDSRGGTGRKRTVRSYGHAFSRLLESATRYMLDHGQCIGVEMAVAANLSIQKGILCEKDHARILRLLRTMDLVPFCPECDVNHVWKPFEREYNSGEAFDFPIPGPSIGGGTFLDRFERHQLEDAIRATPEVRTAPRVRGRAEYRRQVHGATLAAIAFFTPDDQDGYFVCGEPEDVRYDRFSPSEEERRFASRIAFDHRLHGALFDAREAKPPTRSRCVTIFGNCSPAAVNSRGDRVCIQ